MSEPEYDDIASYAIRIRVPKSWVRNAVTAGRIHCSRVGRHVRFTAEDHKANEEMWRKSAVNGVPKPERPRPEQSAAVAQFQPRPSRRRTAA